MAVVVAELRTVERSFGFEPDDLVIAGDRFAHRFRVEDPTDCLPADFTGLTPAFDILSDTGAIVLSSADVTPSPGDITGEFLVVLTDAQTTSLVISPALSADYAYRLRIDDGGGIIVTLFCGQFRVQLCRADT